VPPELLAWAADQAELLSAGLRDSGVHVVGDVAELLADRDAARLVPLAAEPAEMVDAAVASAAALAGQLYQHMYPARLPRPPLGGPRRALSELEWRVLHGRVVQRELRRASRLRAVRCLRVVIWRVLMRPGRRRTPVPARQPSESGMGSVSKAA
jgi:hypothetical protein